MPAARQVVVQSFSGQFAQRLADALQFRPHAVHLDFRRGQIARQRAGGFAGSRLAAARDFPPENRMAEMFQPLRDGGKIVADRAGAANQQIRPRKMLAVLEGRQHRAHRTKRGVNAHRFRLLQQLVAAFHEARRPPRAVGIKRPHARQRIGHDRHGAEVFHRADNFVAVGAGLMQPLVFRQQKIPEPQRGGRVVELQLLQPEIFFADDMTPQRPAVSGFAQAVPPELLVAVVPLVQVQLARRGVHFERFHKSLEAVELARGGARFSAGFEQQNRQAESFPQGLRLGAPKIAAGEMPEHDAAHAAGRQPRLQPGIKPRVRPLEHVNDVVTVAVDERVEWMVARRPQIQTPETGCVRRFRWRSARRVRRRLRFRPAISSAARETARRPGRAEFDLPARPAAAAKKRRPNEIAPRLRQIRAENWLAADSSKRFRVAPDCNISCRNSSGDGARPPMARRNCPSRSSSERKICSGRRRLPRCRQVEQKGAALSAENRRVKAAPQLVAGRRKNHGGIRPRLGKPDRGLRKRADAGGKRPRAGLEIFRRPDAARLQPVRPDPFGGNPRAGEEHVHLARRFYRVFSATMRPWMIFPAWASD